MSAWPPAGRARLTPRRSPEPWAFAVEDTTLQLTWRAMPPGPLIIRSTDQQVTVAADGGPGSVTLTGCPPSTTLAVDVVDARGRHHRTTATTLPSLEGPERFRFATLSDLHLASRTFGYLDTIQEDHHPAVGSSEHATASALADALAWGAQLIVLKGDLTHRGSTEDWAALARVLEACPVPIVAIPGNHDTKGSLGSADAGAQLHALGVPTGDPLLVRDAPGVRIVLAATTRSGVDRGRFHHVADLALDALAGAGPAFLATHHQLQPHTLPMSWPPGIAGHHGRAFLDQLIEANPTTVISSGHTHRSRRRDVGPLVLTEVGSPKDFPGSWGGYVVHDAGIRQVVRRVSDARTLAWTDRTARAAGGLWGRWSPGPLAHRCFVYRWPT